MSLNSGVRMNGYKRVRRELGTIAYDVTRKPNVYEQFYEKEAEAVREFVKHTKPSPKEKNEQPKTVEIKEKKNKMEDIMALINDTEPVKEEANDNKDISETTEPAKETPKQVGGSHMKTIRVTNVHADAKKNKLIL